MPYIADYESSAWLIHGLRIKKIELTLFIEITKYNQGMSVCINFFKEA